MAVAAAIAARRPRWLCPCHLLVIHIDDNHYEAPAPALTGAQLRTLTIPTSGRDETRESGSATVIGVEIGGVEEILKAPAVRFQGLDVARPQFGAIDVGDGAPGTNSE